MKVSQSQLIKIVKEEISNALSEAATLQHQTKAAQREYLNSLPESDRAAYEEWERLSLEEPDSMEEAEPINQRMEELEPIVIPIKRELAAIGKSFASKRDPIKRHPPQGGGIRGTAAGPDDYGQMYE